MADFEPDPSRSFLNVATQLDLPAVPPLVASAAVGGWRRSSERIGGAAVLLRSASDFVAVRNGFPAEEFLFFLNRYSARCTSKIPAHDSMRVAQPGTLLM